MPSSPKCWDADKTYTVKILGGSFPIDEGTTQVGPFLLYCCGDKDCFPVACDQLVGTVYGWLYVPAGNLFDAEQGATAKAIGDAFGISKEWVRLHYRSNKRPTSRTAMGAMAMLSLLLTMASSAQAEGSWCLNKGGTGSTNCGYYSYQQCMASVSGGTSFCTQNGFYQNYPARRTLRR